MQQGKRGVSQAIEYVLLFGFVALAMVGVFFWAQDRVDQNVGGTVEFLEGDIACDDVRIRLSCSGTDVVVENVGVLTIDNILVRAVGHDPDVRNVSVAPYNSTLLDLDGGVDFEIVPLMQVGDDLVACGKRAVEENC